MTEITKNIHEVVSLGDLVMSLTHSTHFKVGYRVNVIPRSSHDESASVLVLNFSADAKCVKIRQRANIYRSDTAGEDEEMSVQYDSWVKYSACKNLSFTAL
jgi:hypothetical protein